MGHFVLEQLGEPIPDQPTMNLVFHLKKDVESTLSDYSDDKILSLPQMADDKKLVNIHFVVFYQYCLKIFLLTPSHYILLTFSLPWTSLANCFTWRSLPSPSVCRLSFFV